jgi:hypothetical protein
MELKTRYNNLFNCRVIKATVIPATNKFGTRIKIFDARENSENKRENKKFSYCYKTDCVKEQAFNLLIKNGFNIVCTGTEKDNYVFMCDNWGDNYKRINQLKK